MPRVLVLNTNTSAAITDLVVRVLGNHSPGIEWHPGTARFGAAYIATEASYAIASHAALDVYAGEGAGCDAVLLACFGDPGLFALREVATVPVVGLAEASMAEAAARGRYAIVTGGAAWKPMLERFAAGLGLGDRLVAVRTVAPSGGDIAADPHGAMHMLAEACNACAREDGAEVVILGGAGLAGLAARLKSDVGVPLIDSLHAGARAVAQSLATAATARARAGQAPTVGLAEPLARLLRR